MVDKAVGLSRRTISLGLVAGVATHARADEAAGGRAGPIKAVVFDALGTLFDTSGVEAAALRMFPKNGQQLTRIWRLKQLEYTWLAVAAGTQEPLSSLNRKALEYAARQSRIDLSAEKADALFSSYALLPAFPDVMPGLALLKGVRLAILSGSGPALLSGLVEKNHLSQFNIQLISTEIIKTFKPDPKAYRLGSTVLGLNPEEILFISSNGFDTWGAGRFGHHTAWLDRSLGPASPAQEANIYDQLRSSPETLSPLPENRIEKVGDITDILSRL